MLKTYRLNDKTVSIEMEVIADVQGFCIPHFTAKEIAILSRDGKYIQHFIVKPPVAWQELDRKSKGNVRWLQTNHHGLMWDDGYVSYQEMENILRKIFFNVEKVYVKGDVKQIFFQKYLEKDCQVIDLINSPSLRKSKDVKKYCFSHSKPFVCSLNNVHILKKSLDDDLIEEFEEKYTECLKIVNKCNLLMGK